MPIRPENLARYPEHQGETARRNRAAALALAMDSLFTVAEVS